MSRTVVKVEPPGWLGRQLGVSWIELWTPQVVYREHPIEGKLRIQPLSAVKRSLQVRLIVRIEEDNGDEVRCSQAMPVEPAEQQVLLEGGWRVEIPFRADFPLQHNQTWDGRITAHVHGEWLWQNMSVKAPYTLTPPDAFHRLAQRVSELTEFDEIQWSVSRGDEGPITYLARFLRSGKPHALLSDLTLEMHQSARTIYATLSVSGGLQAFRLRPHPKRLNFSVQWGSQEQELGVLKEFLRPYDARIRSLPLTAEAPHLEAEHTLPLPSRQGSGDPRDLPAPSSEPEGK